MLVLTRKVGETIIIDGNIRLTVVSVGPGRVKIGIAAPDSVLIDREEVHDRKITGDGTLDVPTLHNRLTEQFREPEIAVAPMPQPKPAPVRKSTYRNKPR